MAGTTVLASRPDEASVTPAKACHQAKKKTLKGDQKKSFFKYFFGDNPLSEHTLASFDINLYTLLTTVKVNVTHPPHSVWRQS